MSLGLGIGISLGMQQPSGAGAPAAVTLNPTNGVNKQSGITLSNGNLTMIDDGSGNYEFVRVTRAAAAGDVQFEVTLVSGASPNFVIAIEDGTEDFTASGGAAIVPGASGFPTTGISFDYPNTGTVFFVYNGGGQGSAAMTPALADVFTVQINRTTGTFKVLRNGTLVAGSLVTGLSFTNWYAAIGTIGATKMTANFAGAFAFGANAAY